MTLKNLSFELPKRKTFQYLDLGDKPRDFPRNCLLDTWPAVTTLNRKTGPWRWRDSLSNFQITIGIFLQHTGKRRETTEVVSASLHRKVLTVPEHRRQYNIQSRLRRTWIIPKSTVYGIIYLCLHARQHKRYTELPK